MIKIKLKAFKMFPSEDITKEVFSKMINENIKNCFRYTQSNQNYVYGIETEENKYVLRMALPEKTILVNSAIIIQEKLLALKIPVAKFIKFDLEGKYSPFLSLLMKCEPGTDLCNIYNKLSIVQKENLAKEIFNLQKATNGFLESPKYGFAYLNEYGIINSNPYDSWFHYIQKSIEFHINQIKKTNIINLDNVETIYNLVERYEQNLNEIKPLAFLRDISERNVLIHNNKISAIVDIDDMGFGDSLLVVALTEVALLEKGYDNIYTQHWKNQILKESNNYLLVEQRYQIYKILYSLSFIRSVGVKTSNNQTVNLNIEKLQNIINESIKTLEHLK